MTIDELKKTGWIIIECIVGSTSFGLNTEQSDVDVRGVYMLPMEERIKFNAEDQVADEMNNNVYWEVGKFIQLLNKANPSSLELLHSPDRCILKGKPWLEFFRKTDFLTMQCQDTFVKYAQSQMQRAYGLNKKVFDPQPEEAPKVLDYCYVLGVSSGCPSGGAKKLKEWLATQPYYANDQKWYALAAIDHVDMLYSLYRQLNNNVKTSAEDRSQPEHLWRWAYGVVRDEQTSNDIQLQSIPKGISPVGFLFFNRNAYSRDCTKHTQYWDWVAKRNDVRYENTIKQGKGYDAKNMMHCIRLLMTAKDIAKRHELTVDRTADREYLFKIKNGEFTYDEIVRIGNELVDEVNRLFETSGLKKGAALDNDGMNDLLLRAFEMKQIINGD